MEMEDKYHLGNYPYKKAQCGALSQSSSPYYEQTTTRLILSSCQGPKQPSVEDMIAVVEASHRHLVDELTNHHDHMMMTIENDHKNLINILEHDLSNRISPTRHYQPPCLPACQEDLRV